METERFGSLKTTLKFVIDGKEEGFSRDFVVPLNGHNSGPETLALEIFADVQKELLFGKYWDAIENPSDLGIHKNRSYSIEDQWTGEYLFLENTRAVWFEIQNNLLEARYLLAQSRAHKAVELAIIEEQKLTPESARENHRVLNIHLNKLDAFDRAVYLLARIEDLFLLMLFVNLGNSLVEDVDVEKPDWQKDIVWRKVKDGLKRRGTQPDANPYLNALSDADYAAIMETIRSLKGIQEVKEITDYRDSTTHRVRPSVDYPGFTAQLSFPKVREEGKVIVMSMPALSSSLVDHQFLELYEKATKVYAHYVNVLRKLKRIPRFV
jgi:hypothetical protein